MISNARRHLADQEWRMVQFEEQQSVELIGLSNQILDRRKHSTMSTTAES
jgi:hypothetical protein